jgi:hypothetical protein
MTDATLKFNGKKCVGRIQPTNCLMGLMYTYKNYSYSVIEEYCGRNKISIRLNIEG